jgi:ATP-dependent DNA helicase RecQ
MQSPCVLQALSPKNLMPHEVLRDVFGFEAFRPGQEDIIQTLSNGEHVLAVMPTGAGKSLCYQVPALARGGLAIVVSPLVALMQNQVAALTLLGVKAATINSSLSRAVNVETWKQLVAGHVKILYLSPERLMDERMLGALQRRDIRLIAIDEAHCISQWGPSFRPEYTMLQNLGAAFPETPIGAFTATADAETRSDIMRQLFGGKGKVFVSGFDRPNISIHVGLKTSDTEHQLKRFLSGHPGKSGIIYSLSRASTEKWAGKLVDWGYTALPYHAGLSAEKRASHQDIFMTEKAVIICATIAFGMGIDKPDVRFVFHADLPSGLDAYYQEIGRAGRDGEPAEAHMIYSIGDIAKRRRFVTDAAGDATFKQRETRKLNKLVAFCETQTCRRKILLTHFGEASDDCGNCDRCRKDVTVTIAARKDRPAPITHTAELSKRDDDLLQKLKALRLALAKKRRVPAYVIFGDKSLIDMAGKKPTNLADFAEVDGVGQAKLAQFGQAFTGLIRSSLESA